MNLFIKILIIILSIIVGAAAILTPIYFTVPTFKEKVDNIFADSEQPENPDEPNTPIEPDTPEPEVPAPQYETNSLLNLTPTTLQLQDTGSENSDSNPYQINNADDLRTLAYYVNTKFAEDDAENLALQQQYTRGHFVLTNHIDISKWTQWEPIGTEENPFVGIFSGNGYSIYGLTIIDSTENEATSEYAGLFGVISYVEIDDVIYKPVIERLGLKDTVIKTNREYAGAIVGAAYGNEEIITPTYQTKTEEESIGGDETANRTYSDAQAAVVIQDCYNTGYVEGGNYVGGLAGAVYYGAVIYNCYNAPSTTNTYNTEYDVYSNNENASGVGGIVGYVEMAVNAAAVNNTISTVKVGKLNVSNASTDIGYVIGRKTAIQSYFSRYSNNIYVTRELTFQGDAGYGNSLNILTASTNRYTQRSFSITQYSTDQWGSDTNTIWVMQLNANNGLPVLYNVPQLVQITVNATDGQGNAISKEKVSAYIDTEHCTPAFTTFTGNKYFTHGQFAYITAEVKDASLLNDYEFTQWNCTLLGDSLAPENLNERMQLEPIFNVLTNKDCVFTIIFDLKNTCGVEVTESCARLGFDTKLNVSKADTSTSWNIQETATIDASSNYNASYVIVEIKVADAYKDAVTIEDNTITIDFAQLYEQFKTKEIIVPIEIIYDYIVPSLPSWTGGNGNWVGGSGSI